MRAGWVWTNDVSAPAITTAPMLPMMGVGTWWFGAVLVRGLLAASVLAILALVQKFGLKS